MNKSTLFQHYIKFFILIFLLLNAQVPALSESRNAKRNLSDYLNRASAYGFSGQVLIAENGKILLNQAFGYADKESRTLTTQSTAFNIASFTKQFTATAILRLETDGKLKTSDAIDKYLENVPADKSSITIHQLLTHTSGLSRGSDGKKNTTRDETVAQILKQSLSAKAGERFNYSNSGYHLLAAIIEKVSGQTFASYVSEKLFKPAGMSKTGFYQDNKWKNYPVAQTYNEWTKLAAFTEWNKGWNYGTGSIISNAGELYKWFTALSANKILPPEEKEKLFQKYTASSDEDTSYGYGWFVRKLSNGKTLIYHGGDNPGYHTEFRWYVEDKRLIVVLANYEMLEPDGAAVQKRIIAGNLNRILNGEEYKQPPPFIKQSAEELKKYEGDYELASGARFKISSDGTRLNISAEGQEAINALAGYEGDDVRKYAEATELTEFIVKNLTSGEKEKIKSRMSLDDYNFIIPFLAKEIEDFKKKLGELREIKVQGTTAFPWDANNYRTNVLLKFEKGATDFYLGWENGKPNDLTTETGRPFPLIVPLAAQSKTEFSTYEIIGAKLVSINFSIDKKISELSIKFQDRELKAKKLQM
jgi:CubicO group peptidase (beta-lactamase class C family)